MLAQRPVDDERKRHGAKRKVESILEVLRLDPQPLYVRRTGPKRVEVNPSHLCVQSISLGYEFIFAVLISAAAARPD
jgi:hypothetical protein